MSRETVVQRQAPRGVVPAPLDPAALEGPLWSRGPRPSEVVVASELDAHVDTPVDAVETAAVATVGDVAE